MLRSFIIAVVGSVSLSFAQMAHCDDESPAESYVVLSSGFELGKRTNTSARGYGLDVGFGAGLPEGLFGHLFLGSFSRRFTGRSLFVQSSYGVAAVADLLNDESMAVQPALGAIYKIGNEWSWSTGFIFGVEWAGIGALISYSEKGFVPIISPRLLQLRFGWSFS